MLFTENTSMDFRKVIYQNIGKKHSFQTFRYIILLWPQTFSSFMKFYFVHTVKVCFVFKKQSLCLYIPPYMHKTLPTLGNDKKQQQIKFYEKLLGKLIFLRATKYLKMFYCTCPTRRVLKK